MEYFNFCFIMIINKIKFYNFRINHYFYNISIQFTGRTISRGENIRIVKRFCNIFSAKSIKIVLTVFILKVTPFQYSFSKFLKTFFLAIIIFKLLINFLGNVFCKFIKIYFFFASYKEQAFFLRWLDSIFASTCVNFNYKLHKIHKYHKYNKNKCIFLKIVK